MEQQLTITENKQIVNWEVPSVPEPVRVLIANKVQNGCQRKVSEQEIEEFIYYAAALNLNPLKNQIYAIDRNNKLTYQTSIEGLRAIGHRTGECTGAESWPIYRNGELWGAKATVKRNGFPFTANVKFSEYRVTGKQGFMWDKMPESQICKCAEAKAWRMGFPEVGSLYIEDEMGRADRRVNRENIPELPKIPTQIPESEETDDEYLLKETYRMIVEETNRLKISKKIFNEEFQTEVDQVAEYKNNKEYEKALSILNSILASLKSRNL